MPDIKPVTIPDGPWPFGIDSVSDMLFVPKGCYRGGFNGLNKGGIFQTRPGFSVMFDSLNTAEPRGVTMFYPKNKVPTLVKAIGQSIRFSPYPFTTWASVGDISLDTDSGPVYMTNCIMGAETQDDGTLKILTDSFPILMIQDGLGRAWSWDGSAAREMNPDPSDLVDGAQTVIGSFGTWAGYRYWVAFGSRLYASNILEPTKFTESDKGIAFGGYFTLPGIITGMGKTADEKSLLVFTATTTSAFQITLKRDLWSATPGFQSEILPNIGCVAHRSIMNQYGMLWWESQGGYINLDEALNSYRSSKIRYKDNNMNVSKGNLSSDRSQVCAGTFENFLMLSVPSGHADNAQTWIMDEMASESDEAESAPAWASIWTGLSPVEWVTADVYGRMRCFCLSRDLLDEDPTFTANLWEAFISERQDQSFFNAQIDSVAQSGNNTKYFVAYPDGIDFATLVGRKVIVHGTEGGGANDGTFTITLTAAGWFQVVNANGVTNASESGAAAITLPVDVPVSFELRYLSNDTDMKTFHYAMAMVSELKGTTRHIWYYASRHSGYLQIMDKTTVATVSNVEGRTSDIGPDADALIRQTRELRSVANVANTGDGDKGVEDYRHTRNRDRGFSLLFTWVGQAAYNYAALVVQPRSDKPTGRNEPNETKELKTRASGTQELGLLAPIEYTVPDEARRSAPVRSVTSRVIEREHNLLLI